MIRVSVNASRCYDVIMQRGALANAAGYIIDALGLEKSMTGTNACGKKICIVTDANVDTLYGQPDQALWRSLVGTGFDVYKYSFPGGEQTKNMDTIAGILNYLADRHFSRSDILLALGGGIVGDVTGFAAATFLRGIEFIQVPTSLLAIVDSSVGGKTGVNLNAGKNLAGAFWQPSLVLFDPDVLSTLPEERKLDGVAETLKAGIIADKELLRLVADGEAQGTNGILADDDFLTSVAARAVEVKRQIVEEDERESGKRQLLNLGHTIAHAIEKCSDYQISHGHAVAIGMDMVSAAADAFGWSEENCHEKIHDILQAFGFPLDCPYTPEELAGAALQDKKVRGSHITLVIPSRLGNCRLTVIPTDDLRDFIAAGMDAR